MPDSNRKSLTVLNAVHEIATSRHKKEREDGKTDLSFIKWFSDYIMMSFEKDDFVKDYVPFLEKIGYSNNMLSIRDNNTNRIADITLKDEKLYCSLDESYDCIHIHFALALPELSKLKRNS